MINLNKNIIRNKVDTYPESAVIALNGIVINTDSWDIFMIVKEVHNDGTIKMFKISGSKDDFKKGKMDFYPREKYSSNITDPGNIVAEKSFAYPGTHAYEIIVQKDSYYTDISGGFVYIDDNYVVYDSGNATHATKDRLSKFKETMSYQHGSVIVEDSIYTA